MNTSDGIISPDALLMQTKAESRGRLFCFLLLYIAGAALIGSQYLGPVEFEPTCWLSSTTMDRGERSLELMLASTNVSAQLSVRLNTDADGTALATLMLKTEVRLKVSRSNMPFVRNDAGCLLPELLVFSANGSTMSLATPSALVDDAVPSNEIARSVNNEKRFETETTIESPLRPPPPPPPASTFDEEGTSFFSENGTACAALLVSAFTSTSWSRVLDSSRVHVIRCPQSTSLHPSRCEPRMLIQLDTSPGYLYRIRLTLPAVGLSAPAAPPYSSVARIAGGASESERFATPLLRSRLEVCAPTSSQRWRQLGWLVALMLLTLAARHWFDGQLNDFLRADLLPTQSAASLVALCVALHSEPFSALLQLVRGGHAFSDVLESTRFTLAYAPLLSFAHVYLSTVTLRKRPAIIGFWLPKLLLLVCLVLPLTISWAIRTPSPILTRLGDQQLQPNPSWVDLAIYWLRPLYHDTLRQPLELSGLKDEAVALLLAEAIALCAYVVALLVVLAAALYAEDISTRRGWWQPLGLALFTAGCTATLAAAELSEAVTLEPSPHLRANTRLWLVTSLTWMLLVAVSPAYSMRQLIGTSGLRERAELCLRLAERPLASASTNSFSARCLNDLRWLTPRMKVRTIASFVADFSMHHDPDQRRTGAEAGRSRPTTSASIFTDGEAQSKRKASVRIPERPVTTAVAVDGRQNIACWLQYHMSCNLHFLPSWGLGTIYLVLYGLVALVAVLTFTGSSALPKSAVMVETYLSATGCASPLDAFDANECSGVDALRGDEIRMDVIGTVPLEREMRVYLRPFNRAYRFEGLLIPCTVSVSLYARRDSSPVNGSRAAIRALSNPLIRLSLNEEFNVTTESGSGGLGEVESQASPRSSVDEEEWIEIRTERLAHRVLTCFPERQQCEDIRLAWDDGITYSHYQYRVRMQSAPAIAICPRLGCNRFIGRVAALFLLQRMVDMIAPRATSVISHLVAARAAEVDHTNELRGTTATDLSLPLGEVGMIVRRDAAAWTTLQVQLGLTSSALSFMMLVMSVWQGLGTGSPTPQQRVAPLALLAAILYSNNGLPPFVLLLAPSHLKLGWAVSRMVTKAICLCIFALFILVEVHAHGYDDHNARVHLPTSSPKRTFWLFWAPKLVLSGLSTTLMTILAGNFVVATQGQQARVDLGMVAFMTTPDIQPLSIALALVGGLMLVYYIGTLSWVAIRGIPKRKLRDEHRARFFWQALGSALFVCTVFGSEAFPLLLDYMQLGEGPKSWSSDETSAAEVITMRVSQLFAVNLYFCLQAWLYLPSAGMRALRRGQRSGVDLQREALLAVLPSLVAARHASANPSQSHRQPAKQPMGRPVGSHADSVPAQTLLRNRLMTLGEKATQDNSAESKKGFFGLGGAAVGEEEARCLKAIVSHRVLELGLLLKELSFHPARANDLLCDEVRARFDDLEAAATAGQAASSTASVLSTASDVSGWAAIATEARDGEMPSWEIAPLLGTEMVVEACRARARLALDALHARLQRLRDVLNSRSAINPLCMLALNMVEVAAKRNLATTLQEETTLSEPEAALVGFLASILAPEHLPLPFGLRPQKGGEPLSSRELMDTRSALQRFQLFGQHARWLPWSKTVGMSDALGSQLLDALTGWLDAIHVLDSALLGFVVYSDLPPAELSEAVQAEWRNAILNLEGTPEALLRIRPFLLSRPELVRMAETIDDASTSWSLLGKPLKRKGIQYDYAILLKDMSGYTIEACASRRPWRSRVLTFESRVHTPAGVTSSHSDEWNDECQQSIQSIDLHGGEEFAVEFGGSMPWGITPSAGQLRTKMVETDMQLWLQLWLRGSLQRDNDDYEELRRIKAAFRGARPANQDAMAIAPSRFSLRLKRISISGGKSQATMRSACLCLDMKAKFALSFRVLRLTTLGGEEVLGTARWIPPWRSAWKLLDAQKGSEEFEVTASRLRDEWLQQENAESALSEVDELPLLANSGERVGTLNVVVHAVDAYRQAFVHMECEADGTGASQPKDRSDVKEEGHNERVNDRGRYLLRTQRAPWEDLYQALASCLARQRTGLFSLSPQPPDWLLQLHQRIGLGRERPQHALVLELSADEYTRLTTNLKGNPRLNHVTLKPCLKFLVRLVSLEINQQYKETLRAQLCARNRQQPAKVIIEGHLEEQLSATERRKVFSPFSANQLLDMAELRDSDYVNTIIQRLQAAHFHTRAIRVNAEELPMVRTAKDDAKYGKQILLLLGLHPDKVAEEFAIIQRARFEREGSTQVMMQETPTSAEQLQIIDRLLRRPYRYGGAELHHPHRPELARLGRDAAYPPPSWHVGGVELIEACYPLHDQEFNRELQKSIKSSWFLSEAQLTVIRGHYGEEIGFMFAYYDMKNRLCVPVAIVGTIVSLLKLSPSVAGSKAVAVLNTCFGLIMVLWGAAVLVLWQRQKAHLQHVWGVEHFQGRSYERPEFECWHDAATGNPRYYPTWMRNAKRALSLLVTFLQVCFLVTLTLLIYIQYVTSTEFFTGLAQKFWASGVNSLLYGFVIMVLELGLFRHISGLLSEFENWQLQSEYESAYVFKVFFFIFVDGYLWYWVLGFFHIPIIRDNSLPDGTMSPEFAKHFTIFGIRVFSSSTTVDEWVYSFEYSITLHVVGVNFFMLALENLLPVLLEKYNYYQWRREAESLAKRRPEISEICGRWDNLRNRFVASDQVEQLRRVLREGNQERYNTFWDMYDLVLYTGYQSVMSLLQPMTPFLFLINDLLEVRTDPLKITMYQRALPQTKRDLGEWERCLWFQLYAAVLQVALFICFSTKTLEQLWFTDAYDPAYFVDGRLTVASRLSVAFGLCGFMFLCIMVIKGAFSALSEDTVEKHEREKAAVARRVRVESQQNLSDL